jgi:hypothetical protein
MKGICRITHERAASGRHHGSGLRNDKQKATRGEVLRLPRWVSRTSRRELHEVATDVVRGDALKWPAA